MKHRVYIIIITAMFVTSCQWPGERPFTLLGKRQLSDTVPAMSRDSTGAASTAGARQRADDSLQAVRRQALLSELKYYLDRHNVQDEGYEMVAAYAEGRRLRLALHDDSIVSVLSVGKWRGVSRQGMGLERDSCGRIIIGSYESDTLSTGVRVDSAGVYTGDFARGVADGHGSYQWPDGTYYEGQWSGDQRHGFGFAVSPFTHVRVGEWKAGNYLGERMQYTSERIYGIDISRYQHGKGRKKYAILWNRLRITHLGGRSQQYASGQVDYPVSFVFIKSTEGTAVRNPYYAQDYLQARKRGIPIGAYHFFSWRSSGSAQARYFLQSTFFRRGDLPPVLDLELTAAQIARMGGVEVMFKHVRSWLKAVEQRAGVKPILYVNQTFVNRYLSDAPDLKHGYQVWIARYGEYRPDVKLAVWQLSPNGRVTGIHGEVDINVFNGFKTQFEEFLSEMTINNKK